MSLTSPTTPMVSWALYLGMLIGFSIEFTHKTEFTNNFIDNKTKIDHLNLICCSQFHIFHTWASLFPWKQVTKILILQKFHTPRFHVSATFKVVLCHDVPSTITWPFVPCHVAGKSRVILIATLFLLCFRWREWNLGTNARKNLQPQ